MKVTEMIANLTETEGKLDQADPMGLKVKLTAALKAIGPLDGERPHMVQTQHRIIADAIYLAHLMAMIGYNVDKFILAASKMMTNLGLLTRYASESRPKVDMVGLVSGGVLLPFASQTEQEADNHRKAFQVMTGDGAPQMHLLPIELSSSQVDARIQPMGIEHHIAAQPEAKLVKMEGESEEDVTASVEALAAALAPSTGDKGRGK